MNEKISLQEALAEELTLLPGRVSRCFFLMATLDAQVAQLDQDLKTSRQKALHNLRSKRQKNPDEMQAFMKQFNAVQQLQQAQRELLADKLHIERKSAEWFQKAQSAVLRYNSEMKYLQQQQSLESLPSWTGGGSTAHSKRYYGFRDYTVNNPYSSTHRRQQKQILRTQLQDAETYDAVSVVSDNNESLLFDSKASKKRKLSHTAESRTPQRTHSRRVQGSETCHSSSTLPRLFHSTGTQVLTDQDSMSARPAKSESLISLFSPTSTTRSVRPSSADQRDVVIIKLGSQKGRPRKSMSKSQVAVPSTVIPTEPSTNESATATAEDYICPICEKSENDNPSMVACDNCDRWYHCVCVGFVDEADAASKAFYCPNCVIAESDADPEKNT